MRSWKRPILFVMGTVVCVLFYLFLLNIPEIGAASPTAGVIPVLLLAGAMVGLTALALRAEGWSGRLLGVCHDQRPFACFAAGLAAGAALAGLWMCAVTVIAGASWRPNPGFSAVALVLACLFHLFNNLGEELAYRGYLFLRLAKGSGAPMAVLVTSGVFALLHLQAGLPWLSVLAGVFTSGLVFGAVFARWRSLPLALGVHVATNLIQDVTGLRAGASSLWVSEQLVDSAGQGTRILLAIAALNTGVALALLAWPRGGRVTGRR